MKQPMPSLSADQLAYIDEIGLLIAEGGLARSVGRVMGFLLICQPARQSAEDIQRLLGLSAGSVSNAVSLLLRLQLVERTAIPGERRLYYQLHPRGWEQLLRARLDQVRRGSELIATGIATYGSNPRLEGLHELYEKSFEAMDRIKLSQLPDNDA